MSAWEDISSTYAEAATKALPLHRLAIFASGFLASLAVQHQTHLSILETISVIPISDFVALDKGALSGATAANALWAIGATIGGVSLSKLMTRLAYGLVDRATGASKKASQLETSKLSGLSIEERKSALDLVESSLVEPRARLRAMAGANELLVGIVVVFGLGSYWGNAVDIGLSVLSFAIAMYSHLAAIHEFLNNYYGPALAKAHLQGKPLPHIANIG